jgi:hypothetical protein
MLNVRQPDGSSRVTEEKVKSLIRAGSDLVGATAGGALGFLAAGPAGAAVAGAAGVVIAEAANSLLSEVANRQLSHREQVRVGAAASIALSTIRDRLDAGDAPREDGFFSSTAGARAPAEEILEGVLLKSKAEHEEKKVRLLGTFFATLAFSPTIDLGEANFYLRAIERLSYRQLCLIALFASPAPPQARHLRTTDYRSANSDVTYEQASILQDIFEMIGQGLIVQRPRSTGNALFVTSLSAVVPSQATLTPFAQRIADLVGAPAVPPEDIEPLASLLAEPEAPGSEPSTAA